MSLLGEEKASEKRFRISGKFTGGVGSSGTWNPTSTHTYGNDWEAQERYKLRSPTPSIGERLAANQKKKNLGAVAPNVTVKTPGTGAQAIKSKAVSAAKAAAVEAGRKKAKSLLSPRAQSEMKRLENLFQTR